MLICVKKNIFLTSRIFDSIFQAHQHCICKFISLINRNLTHNNINIFSFISLKYSAVNWGKYLFFLIIVKKTGLKSAKNPDFNPVDDRISSYSIK